MNLKLYLLTSILPCTIHSTSKQLTSTHRRTVSDSALDELANNLENDQNAAGMGCIMS